jgi:replicative DNA helicase
MAGRGLRVSSHPNNSISARDIRATLDTWEHFDGFIPDVVVIDYADILAPIDNRKEHRHQQNETWQTLRGLSQERHCLVITATQADADSYDRHHLSLNNFSEDKRKYGHVTAMLALNQTQEEKATGIMRIGVLLAREGEVDARSEVAILQCLRAGQPCLASY